MSDIGPLTEVLKPHLAVGDFSSEGKIILETINGDLHDIDIVDLSSLLNTTLPMLKERSSLS